MEEWIKRVKLAANECEYQEHDRQIREQFICGLNDEHMQSKIISEVKARSKADKITSEQVLMWAIQEESNRTEMWEAGQNDCKVVKANTHGYCGSIHLPRKCSAFGMTCGECHRVNHFSTVCRAPRWVASRPKEQYNGQTKVKNDQFIHNYSYVKASIEAKISTSSFHNSINIRYRLDTGRSCFHKLLIGT